MCIMLCASFKQLLRELLEISHRAAHTSLQHEGYTHQTCLSGMQAYEEYFKYLDRTGGFFYERWGDAPVHSLGAVMLLNSSQVQHLAKDCSEDVHPRVLRYLRDVGPAGLYRQGLLIWRITQR